MQAESRQCLSSNVKCQRNLVTWAGLWFYPDLLSNLLSAYKSCVSCAGSTGSCETNSEQNLQHMICNTDTPPRILLLKLRQKYEFYPSVCSRNMPWRSFVCCQVLLTIMRSCIGSRHHDCKRWYTWHLWHLSTLLGPKLLSSEAMGWHSTRFPHCVLQGSVSTSQQFEAFGLRSKHLMWSLKELVGQGLYRNMSLGEAQIRMDLITLTSVSHMARHHVCQSLLVGFWLQAQSTAVPSLFGVNTAMEAKHIIPKDQIVRHQNLWKTNFFPLTHWVHCAKSSWIDRSDQRNICIHLYSRLPMEHLD